MAIVFSDAEQFAKFATKDAGPAVANAKGYYSIRTNRMVLFDLTANGKNARRLTDSAGSNESPTWSPDNRHIMFTSNRGGSPQLWSVNFATGEEVPVSRLRIVSGYYPTSVADLTSAP